MDKIHIHNLLVRCVIGAFEHERDHRQDVVFDITLHADLGRAADSDNLDDTIDYKALRDQVVLKVEASSFHLLEALAEQVAAICLAHPLVEKVNLTVHKPGALTFAKDVAVEITRP